MLIQPPEGLKNGIAKRSAPMEREGAARRFVVPRFGKTQERVLTSPAYVVSDNSVECGPTLAVTSGSSSQHDDLMNVFNELFAKFSDQPTL